MPGGVVAGQQTGAGGLAVGGVGVGIGEDHALLGHAVEHGGFEDAIGLVASVIPTLVVGVDQDDVGVLCCH